MPIRSLVHFKILEAIHQLRHPTYGAATWQIVEAVAGKPATVYVHICRLKKKDLIQPKAHGFIDLTAAGKRARKRHANQIANFKELAV